jgi:hypothetical protein
MAVVLAGGTIGCYAADSCLDSTVKSIQPTGSSARLDPLMLGLWSRNVGVTVSNASTTMNRPRLFRTLRIAWSVAWGILAVLLIALWVRSCFRADRLHGPFGRKNAIAWASKQGHSYLLYYETVPQPNAWKSGWYTHSNDDEEAFPTGVMDTSRLGFGILRRPAYVIPEMVFTDASKPGVVTTWNSGTMYLKGTAWMVPDWFLILLAIALAISAWARKAFSLRTLLLATTLVAIGMGLIAWLR